MYKKRKKEKKTYTHNSPAVPTYCINVAIIIMQKNIYLFNVTLAEFFNHWLRHEVMFAVLSGATPCDTWLIPPLSYRTLILRAEFLSTFTRAYVIDQ